MKKFILGFLVFVFIAPQAVLAADSGYYVSGTLGMSADSTIDLDENSVVEEKEDEFITNFFDLSGIEFGSDNNFTGLIAVGKRIGKSYRMELEYGFRNSNINYFRARSSAYERMNVQNSVNRSVANLDKEKETDVPLFIEGLTLELNEHNELVKNNPALDRLYEENMMGDLDIHSLMANFYMDLNEGSKFRPYVGAGVGVAWANYEIFNDEKIDISFYNPKVSGTDIFEKKYHGDALLDETATAFGYQFMAGLGYEVAPKVVLTGGYRLFGTTGEFDTVIHAAEVGIRYSF